MITLQADGATSGDHKDGARNGSLKFNRITKSNGLPSSTGLIGNHSLPLQCRNFCPIGHFFDGSRIDPPFRRRSEGESPERALKTRLKRAGSLNPQAKAISAAERFRVRSKWVASLIRQSSMNRRGVMPVS